MVLPTWPVTRRLLPPIRILRKAYLHEWQIRLSNAYAWRSTVAAPTFFSQPCAVQMNRPQSTRHDVLSLLNYKIP